MEQDRAELLRRRIALYRRYLREGVEGALALEYLRQIAEAEAELNRIEPGERCRPIIDRIAAADRPAALE
jgi:hypothetical protein